MRPERGRAVHLEISSPAFATIGLRGAEWCDFSTRAIGKPARCAGFFLFSGILFRPGPEPLI